jgi:hypothetical protein
MLPAELAMELEAERIAEARAAALDEAARIEAERARVEAAARAADALALHRAGHSLKAVGRALGCSDVWAAELVRRAEAAEAEAAARATARIRYEYDDEGRMIPARGGSMGAEGSD